MDKYQKVTLGFTVVLAAMTGARIYEFKEQDKYLLQQKAAKLVDCVNKNGPLAFVSGTDISTKPSAWLDVQTSIPSKTNGSRLELIAAGKERIGGPSCWSTRNGRLPCRTGQRNYKYKMNVELGGVGSEYIYENFGRDGEIPPQSGLGIAGQVRQIVRTCQLSL